MRRVLHIRDGQAINPTTGHRWAAGAAREYLTDIGFVMVRRERGAGPEREDVETWENGEDGEEREATG